MMKKSLMLLLFFCITSILSKCFAGYFQKPAIDTTDENLKPVFDLDSNKYTVVKVGKQYWMQQNLRTSRYNDTTVIATGLSAEEWKKSTKGAYAIYENDLLNEKAFGKLYNGYAVASGKICPKGWHIPTDKEWMQLEEFLSVDKAELNRTGGRSNVAGLVKATEHWKVSETSVNNKTGLTILPGGTRNDVGDFVTLKQFAGFWTSTEYETASNYLWYRHYYYNVNELGRNYVVKNNGYSCRCLKDENKKDPNASGQGKSNPGKPKAKPGPRVISN
jgi:uncharacterized protein (TIGR02145 family)